MTLADESNARIEANIIAQDGRVLPLTDFAGAAYIALDRIASDEEQTLTDSARSAVEHLLALAPTEVVLSAVLVNDQMNTRQKENNL